MDDQILLNSLYGELQDIERQLEDDTLPHSDQQLLGQAWEDIMNQIEMHEDKILAEEEIPQDIEYESQDTLLPDTSEYQASSFEGVYTPEDEA